MYGNPYFNQQQRFQPVINQTQPMQQYIQPIQPTNNPFGLLGKVVESIDVVKAMDIPLDGSVSYFPLTDGSAVVSKQLQNDGTSKVVVYKPAKEEQKQSVQYLTIETLEDALNEIQELQDIKSDIQEIKKQLKATKKVKED